MGMTLFKHATSSRAVTGNRVLWTALNRLAQTKRDVPIPSTSTGTGLATKHSFVLNELFKQLPNTSTTDISTMKLHDTVPEVATPFADMTGLDMVRRAGYSRSVKPRYPPAVFRTMSPSDGWAGNFFPCQSRFQSTDGSRSPQRWIVFKKDQGPPRHFHAKSNATAAPPLDGAAEYEKNWESETRYNQPHPIWNDEEVHSVQKTHFRPRVMSDRFALYFIRLLRGTFDVCTGYAFGPLSAQGWINRVVLLETVAGVPGLVGACIRHLRSLRRMERDYGWIHTLLEEAENERMHLMSALMIKNPGRMFRCIVVAGQAFFLPVFTTLYFISGRTAHRFVGYLEEEAVKTYTHLLEELEAGHQPGLAAVRAPRVARQYWQLKDDATFTDMIFAIRADESHHRDVNHTFANMRPDEENPFEPGH